jgi:hypothetical protein
MDKHLELKSEFADIDVSDLDLFDIEIVQTAGYVAMPETGASPCYCCNSCCCSIAAT